MKIGVFYFSFHVYVVYMGEGLSTAFYYSFMPLGYPSEKKNYWNKAGALRHLWGSLLACLFVHLVVFLLGMD